MHPPCESAARRTYITCRSACRCVTGEQLVHTCQGVMQPAGCCTEMLHLLWLPLLQSCSASTGFTLHTGKLLCSLFFPEAWHAASYPMQQQHGTCLHISNAWQSGGAAAKLQIRVLMLLSTQACKATLPWSVPCGATTRLILPVAGTQLRLHVCCRHCLWLCCLSCSSPLPSCDCLAPALLAHKSYAAAGSNTAKSKIAGMMTCQTCRNNT